MISSNVQAAATLLSEGKVVAFPTETVYGLGAIAFDSHAVAQIFEIKGRPRFDPLIVHAASAELAFELCERVSTTAERLAAAFWPGPLTLVMAKRPSIPDIVTAGLPSVAVRVPSHPIANQLLRAVGAPLAAPSANRFGKVSPTASSHVEADLGFRVPLILEGGPCRHGVESTIISLLHERPQLLRPGSVAIEAIRALVGEVELNIEPTTLPQSPGQLRSHYAPNTPMRPYREQLIPQPDERVGLLAIGPRSASGYVCIEVLSPSADLLEAASNLFAALRRLDALRLDRIDCEFAPPRGLGLAINDRLSRGCESLPNAARERTALD